MHLCDHTQYIYLFLTFFETSCSTSILVTTGVKAGGDRQELHEVIRVYSMEAGAVVKGQGKPNDLLDRIRGDAKFAVIHDRLDAMIDPSKFVGRAPEQVDEFLADEVDPVLEAHKELLTVENVDGINV